MVRLVVVDDAVDVSGVSAPLARSEKDGPQPAPCLMVPFCHAHGVTPSFLIHLLPSLRLQCVSLRVCS